MAVKGMILSFLFVFLIVQKSLAINPYSEYYGSEYTQECHNYAKALIEGLQNKDLNQLNCTFSKINNKLSTLSIADRAKLCQKLSRTCSSLTKSQSMKKELRSTAKQLYPKLHSYSLFEAYEKEAESYNRELYNKEKEERNKVNILPTDRAINYYLLPASKAINAINGYEYTTEDLNATGKVLISKGGVIKAFTNFVRVEKNTII